AGLHAWDILGALLQVEARHARGDCSRSDNEVFVLREIELIDYAAEQVDINLPRGSDKAGADFDPHSHSLEGLRAGATCNSSLPRNSDSENPATSGGKGQHLYPAVRMAFWQGDKSCRIGSLYACFERHQPLFQSRGKLCALQAGISSGSLASPGTRMRTRAGPCGRGHCFGNGDLDPGAAKKWKYGFRRRTQRRDAPGGRAAAGIVSEIHERGGNGGSYYASRRERRFRHRSPGGALVWWQAGPARGCAHSQA